MSGVGPLYFLFVLLISWPVSDSYDNSNIAVIEVPSTELDDSDQKTKCELKNHDTNDLTAVQGTEELLKMQRGDELVEISRSEQTPPILLKPSSETLRENDFVITNPIANERPLDLAPNEEIYFNNLEYLQRKNDVQSSNLRSYSGVPTLLQLLGSPIVLPPDYALDISNNRNTYVDNSLIFNKQRSRRQRPFHDLLEQLEHDAIMHNILPTMEAPFFRAAYPTGQESQVPSVTKPAAVAYFPEAHGVQIPILLICSPKITQGYQQNPQVPLPYYNSRETYRQDPNLMDGYKK